MIGKLKLSVAQPPGVYASGAHRPHHSRFGITRIFVRAMVLLCASRTIGAFDRVAAREVFLEGAAAATNLVLPAHVRDVVLNQAVCLGCAADPLAASCSDTCSDARRFSPALSTARTMALGVGYLLVPWEMKLCRTGTDCASQRLTLKRLTENTPFLSTGFGESAKGFYGFYWGEWFAIRRTKRDLYVPLGIGRMTVDESGCTIQVLFCSPEAVMVLCIWVFILTKSIFDWEFSSCVFLAPIATLHVYGSWTFHDEVEYFLDRTGLGTNG